MQNKAKRGRTSRERRSPPLTALPHPPLCSTLLLITLPAQLPLPPAPAPFTPQGLLLSDLPRSPVTSMLPHFKTTSRTAGKYVKGGATPPPSGNADSVTPPPPLLSLPSPWLTCPCLLCCSPCPHHSGLPLVPWLGDLPFAGLSSSTAMAIFNSFSEV